MDKASFDPYQPARLIAEALGHAIYEQSGEMLDLQQITQAALICQSGRLAFLLSRFSTLSFALWA